MRTCYTTIGLVILLLFMIHPATISAKTSELLVQFKKGETPHELESIVKKRKIDTPLWYDFTLRLLRKRTPEEKMMRLEQTDTLAGVIAKGPVVVDDEKETLYLVYLDGTCPIDCATTLFSSLPEVVHIEPNYITEEDRYPSL